MVRDAIDRDGKMPKIETMQSPKNQQGGRLLLSRL